MMDHTNTVSSFNGENNNIWARKHTHTHTCAENKIEFPILYIVGGLSRILSQNYKIKNNKTE